MDKKRRDAMNSWLSLRRSEEGLDLSLDVLYSQIRSCMAKVKYAWLENRRHKDELRIFSNWVNKFGFRLREHSRCELQDLLQNAEGKVRDVDEAVTLYVGLVSQGQEKSRDAAAILDKMREEKRAVIGKVAMSIRYSSKEIKHTGVDVLSYDDISLHQL
eukprot:TRINITY_DN35707_c0_g1_i1.p1 TRINITY_DN35707_c0_g1~~TRINITY_DN35707_c0_g1_i1.p1  ORF type:complete len:178 (+),score=8.70 TRINITY_DN35707_c0_g1_i1:60-536(+)